MDTKLTLKLDKNVIDRAKEYASAQNRSLSRMIESYLKTLINTDESKKDDDLEISPFVKSLQSGIKLPANFDSKKEYSDYLYLKRDKNVHYTCTQKSPEKLTIDC